MKKLRYWLNIQLFGEGGGDGGAASGDGGMSAGQGDVGAGSEEIPADIPERARKIYAKAMQKRGKVDTSSKTAQASIETESQTTEEEKPATEKLSFKDLLKSDEDYKKEHDAAVQKAIKERFKTSDAEMSRLKTLLEKDARKYGIDTSSKTYLDDLEAAMDKDDSYYREYAEKNDVSMEAAKKMVTAEEQLKRYQQAEQKRKEAEENERLLSELKTRAEAAKAIYPNLDLNTEMANPDFRRLLAAVNGDVETAYFVTHRKEIMKDTVSKATKQAQANTVNTIRANQGRPSENGLSSTTQADTFPSWKGKGLEGIRAYAEEQRRLRGR